MVGQLCSFGREPEADDGAPIVADVVYFLPRLAFGHGVDAVQLPDSG